MNITVLESINQADETEWNEIVGRNCLIQTHRYMRAVELSRINDCRYFYPVVFDKGRMIAHASIYFISTELDAFAGGVLKRGVEGIRKKWKNFMILRSIECGTPVALGSAVSYREGCDRAAALRCIVLATEAVARRLDVPVVLFRDYYERDLCLYDQLAAMGYTRINNLPSSRMTVRWDSFDCYLNSLRSEYRNKTVARIRRFKAASGSLEILNDYYGYASELAILWQNVYVRAHEYRREVLVADFFQNMARILEGKTVVVLARINGMPAGFMLLLIDDDTVTPVFCGLDYNCSRDAAVYFNLFYKSIEVAIDRKMKDIDFGITTLGPKLELGALVEVQYMYMKHSNVVLNRLVPRLFSLMTPCTGDEVRNVFRS